jgi:oligoribonuclease
MEKMVWVCIETTGLNEKKDSLLEIGVIITDKQLKTLATYERVIHQNDRVLGQMEKVVANMHRESGLYDKVQISRNSEYMVDLELSQFMEDNGFQPDRKAIICGNGVAFEQKFIKRDLPHFAKFLHYRLIDVSSLKEIGKLWYEFDEYKKNKNYTAIHDLQESIAEMQYLKESLFNL